MGIKFYRNALLLICGFLLAGCGSARFTSTLKPSGDPALTLHEQQFRMAEYSLVFDKESDSTHMWYPFKSDVVRQRARTLYPNIFVDDWYAVPVIASAKGHFEAFGMAGPLLTALTGGIIPFPDSETADFRVSVAIVDEQGNKLAIPEVSFQRKNTMWVSILGPLGCLPVPGETLIPRDTMFFDLEATEYYKKTSELNNDVLVEAVVAALRQAPAERLAAITKARTARMKEISIEGATYWSFLAPQFSKGVANQERADQFALLLYRERPNPGIQPAEEAVIARRDATGRWQPAPAYLRRITKGLVSVSALLESGAPARIVVTEVNEPPLEDFVPLPPDSGDDRVVAENMRWSNRVLLQAKNRSLPTLLKDKSTGELLDLVTLVEHAFLDLNRMSELAKDRAQKAVADGADGGAARELSLTCRERGDIMKPILAALKQEVAGRSGK